MLVNEQALKEQPMIMQQRIPKEDCMTVDEVMAELKISKTSLYHYMDILDVQKLKFRFERKIFIPNSEVERIRVFMKDRG